MSKIELIMSCMNKNGRAQIWSDFYSSVEQLYSGTKISNIE